MRTQKYKCETAVIPLTLRSTIQKLIQELIKRSKEQEQVVVWKDRLLPIKNNRKDRLKNWIRKIQKLKLFLVQAKVAKEWYRAEGPQEI